MAVTLPRLPGEARNSSVEHVTALRYSLLQPHGPTEVFSISAPEFTARAGTYPEKIAVGFNSDPGSRVRYIIERCKEDCDSSVDECTAAKLITMGRTFRKPFVLDQYGDYVVHAMAMSGPDGSSRSDIVTAKYTICKTDVQKLQGQRLRTLPTQMVRGVVRLAGVTKQAVANKLGNMKRAIAWAANTSESRVTVEMQKKNDSKASGVEVGFSIEVDREEDAKDIVKGLTTDPSLVKQVADVVGVQTKDVRVKANARRLQRLLLALQWTFPGKREVSLAALVHEDAGSIQAKLQHDYLDGSCLVYSQETLLDVVDYRGAQSVHGSKSSTATCGWSAGRGEAASVLHSGDVMSKTGGKHAIQLQLADLPEHVTDCYFTLSAYNCRNLSLFVSPRMRLFDAENPSHMLCDYEIAQAGCASAAVVCSIVRECEGWAVHSYGQICDGTVRDYTPIETSIAAVQSRYVRRRCREPFVLLHELWHRDRALLRGSEGSEDILIPLLDLQFDLFRHILRFL